jgi:hypothetical protein
VAASKSPWSKARVARAHATSEALAKYEDLSMASSLPHSTHTRLCSPQTSGTLVSAGGLRYWNMSWMASVCAAEAVSASSVFPLLSLLVWLQGRRLVVVGSAAKSCGALQRARLSGLRRLHSTGLSTRPTAVVASCVTIGRQRCHGVARDLFVSNPPLHTFTLPAQRHLQARYEHCFHSELHVKVERSRRGHRAHAHAHTLPTAG